MAKNIERTIDNLLVIRPVGNPEATATGVDSTVVDLGNGFHNLDLYVDVGICEIVENNEHYLIHLLGSHTINFLNETVVLATLELGALEVLGPAAYDRTTGEYVVPCHNSGKGLGGVDTTYRYVKIGYVISGTSPELDFNAWLAKRT